CRGDGLVDPPQLVRLPRLDDGEDIVDRDVERVMPSEVLRSLDDDAGDPQSVRKRLELDALHPDRERHTDLLAPLGSDLVRLHFLAAIGRGTDLISGEDEVVKMPEVVRVLDAELDLAGPRSRWSTRIRGRHGAPPYFCVSRAPVVASTLSGDPR